MIPKVRLWIVTLKKTGERFEVLAPTKLLARLNFRFDYPQHWGKSLTIGIPKKKLDKPGT